MSIYVTLRRIEKGRGVVKEEGTTRKYRHNLPWVLSTFFSLQCMSVLRRECHIPIPGHDCPRQVGPLLYEQYSAHPEISY